MKQDQPVAIYLLRDPRDSTVRYVGVTSQTLDQRLRAHISDAKYDVKRGKDTYRSRWIRSVLDQFLRPSIELIEKVPEEVWAEREVHWIDYYKRLGFLLTNSSVGGRGTRGYKHTEQTKERLRLVAKPPSRKGTKLTQAHKDAITSYLTGRPCSEETRAKLSKTNTETKRRKRQERQLSA